MQPFQYGKRTLVEPNGFSRSFTGYGQETAGDFVPGIEIANRLKRSQSGNESLIDPLTPKQGEAFEWELTHK